MIKFSEIRCSYTHLNLIIFSKTFFLKDTPHTSHFTKQLFLTHNKKHQNGKF